MSWSFDGRRRTILLGEGALEALDSHLLDLGTERVVLLATRRAATSAAAEAVRRVVRKRLVGEFTSIGTRAPIEDVVGARDLALEVEAGCIVAVGGGSTTDAAKAVSLLMGGVPVQGLGGIHRASELDPRVPVIAVPTTLSGAETTRGGMFYVDGHKRGFGGEGVQSQVIVHDPSLLSDVPPAVLLTTGMNGLAHCIEAPMVRAADPITDTLALEGAGRLITGMVSLARGDSSVGVLTTLQVGAALGGLCLDSVGVGIHHALCHALGGICDVPHGSSNSVILPYALLYNESASADAQSRIAGRLAPVLSALQLPDSDRLAQQIFTVQDTIGVPRSLQELGVDPELLGEVADEAYTELIAYANNPRTPESPQEMREVLEAAFRGDFMT